LKGICASSWTITKNHAFTMCVLYLQAVQKAAQRILALC